MPAPVFFALPDGVYLLKLTGKDWQAQVRVVKFRLR